MIANQLRYLLLAIDRYTRFPVPRRLRQWASPEGFDTRRAVRLLPLAGLIAGLYGAILYLLFVQLLPHAVATLLAIIFSTLITGGRQEAALGRFFIHPARQRLARGTVTIPSVMIVLLIVLLRVEALESLDPSWISVALVTAHPLSGAIGAWIAISGMTRQGLGRRAAWTDRAIAAGMGALPVALAAWWFDHQGAFWFAIMPALLFGAWVRLWLKLRLRAFGQSAVNAAARARLIRDSGGAGQQISEIAYYLGLLVWWTLIGAELAAQLGDLGGATEEGEDEEPEAIE